MAEPIVRLYRHLADAQAARQALLQAGFAPQAVALAPQGDEAGGVKGNFVIGNGDYGTSGRADGAAGDYADNFRQVEFGCVFLLSVAAEEDSRREAAAAIMERFHAEPADIASRGACGPTG